MNVPEKHREVAHAWIDGAEVECSREGRNAWVRLDKPEFLADQDYRIKPKPKVKKWRWVFKEFERLEVTNSHYTEPQAAFLALLEKVEITMIEVDADEPH